MKRNYEKPIVTKATFRLQAIAAGSKVTTGNNGS
jgi:hypothetical protein